MNPDKIKELVREILIKDRRYAEDAYYFVNEAVHFASEYFSKPEFGQDRHLSGAELSEAIREFTLSEFGSMSWAVLNNWGVHTTLDFGHIVFNLIDARILHASPSDKLGDFDNVFDLEKELSAPFEPENPLAKELPKIDIV